MCSYKSLACYLLIFQAAISASLEIPLDSTSKVNWGPVDDDIEVHGAEPYANDADEDYASIGPVAALANFVNTQEVVHVHHVPIRIPLYANVMVQTQPRQANGDACAAPQGLGLKHLLKEAKELLPLQKIGAIIRQALSADLQVQALQQVLQSSDFRTQYAALKQSRDFDILRDYACRVLNLDLKYYQQFVRGLFNASAASTATPTNTEFQGRNGIRGLLEDIRAVLPKQQLRDLYQRLMERDEQLVAAVKQLKTNEFQQLLLNLRELSSYQQLRKMLLEVGVPLQELKELIDSALGWQGDEFAGAQDLKI